MESIVPESTVSIIEELLCSAPDTSSNQSQENALNAAISIANQVYKI